MTQQQQQQSGMAELQKRMLESQIGLNQARSDAVMAGGGKGGSGPFGKINPGDFTPESLARYQESGNYGDLDAANSANANVQSVFRTRDGNLGMVLRDGTVRVTDQAMDESYQLSTAPSGAVNAVNRNNPNEVVPVVPEEVAIAGAESKASATASGTATGKASAEAAIDLPKSEIRAQTALDTLDKMEKHIGLSGAVGLKGPAQLFGLREKPVAGSNAADFVALAEQVSGTAFLEAFQELKGGGHITEIEGQKAEQAIARIRNLDQSESAYRDSIKDLRSVIQKGIERKRSAGGAQSSTQDMDFSSMSDDELRRLAGGQ